MTDRLRIGDMLVEAGLIRPDQLEAALDRQKQSGRRLGEELVAHGALNEVQLVQVVSNQLSIPWVSLYHVEFSRELLNLIPAEVAEQHSVIPIYMRRVRGGEQALFVAMDDPTREGILEELTQTVGVRVRPMVAPQSEIRNAIGVYYFGKAPVSPEGGGGVPTPSDEDTAEEAAQLAAPRAEVAASAAVPTDGAPRSNPVGQKEAKPPKPPGSPQTAPSGSGDGPDVKVASAASAGGGLRGLGSPRARMVTLTLLDGTSVRLPAPGSSQPAQEEALTASDLVAALRARAQGKDVSRVLSDDGWESLFATLLTLLIRKGLIADWEFVQEWKQGEDKPPR